MKFIYTFLIITFSISSTYACSCSKVGTLRGQNKSDFVFTGKVVEIKEIITKEKLTDSEKIVDYKRYEFIFEIKHIHKRKKGFDYSEKITIITTGGGTDCGNKFDLNKQYLVYAYNQQNKIGWGIEDQKADKDFMSTNLCTRTKRVSFFTFWEQLILELT
ncbi:hypothetical protein [Flavobacterium sp.]|uniref:hypothetical protein n=1 Tax=Flavobacterium sp. TaxID=239 RepID=UPI00391DF9AE